MAPSTVEATPMEEEEEEEEARRDGEMERTEEEEAAAATFNPSAPSSELFDMKTTIDPSYIISLIRKLLPQNLKNKHDVDASTEESESVTVGETATSVTCSSIRNDKAEDVENRNDTEEYANKKERGGNAFDSPVGRKTSEEKAWEECGCILWDLAANRTHAEFMVENLLLDVLLASLTVSRSVRISEISLGIIANLACHDFPGKQMISMQGLIDTVVDQFFLDDSLCLCEACRLLTLGLQGSGSVTWAVALQAEHILRRILWIAENTLNTQLLDKNLGLLLVMVSGHQEVTQILVPLLMNLDLINMLVTLLASEVNQLSVQRIPDRYSILDTILQVIEALSTVDDYSGNISSNRQLLQLNYDLIKLSDKAEVSSSCVTSMVLLANIMTDEPDLAAEVSQDLQLLKGLLDLIPFVSEDSEAWSALWSILDRILVRVQEDNMTPSNLHQYVLVLIDRSDLIEEDLIDHPPEESNGYHHSSNISITKVTARNKSLGRILSILKEWTTVRDKMLQKDSMREDDEDSGRVDRLLRCCQKHSL